jgi:hypothetical protein
MQHQPGSAIRLLLAQALSNHYTPVNIAAREINFNDQHAIKSSHFLCHQSALTLIFIRFLT